MTLSHMIAETRPDGELGWIPFDPNDPEHRAFVEDSLCGCPMCQEVLEKLLDGVPPG